METVVAEKSVATGEFILGWFWETHPEARTVYPNNGVFYPSVSDKTYFRSEVLREFLVANPDTQIRLEDPESFGWVPRILKEPAGIAELDYVKEHPLPARPIALIVPPTGKVLPKNLIEAVLKADVVKIFLGLMACPEGTINDRIVADKPAIQIKNEDGEVVETIERPNKAPTLLHLAAAIYANYARNHREFTSSYPRGPLCGRHYAAVCELLLTCGADPQALAVRPNNVMSTMPDTPIGWCDGYAPKCLRQRSMLDAKEGRIEWENDRNTSHAERGYH